jgi:hypothetical protein
MKQRAATDHRALVLEAVATSPTRPTVALIVKDCAGTDFKPTSVNTMVWYLRKNGFIGLDDKGQHFITTVGLDYLVSARFDRELPSEHKRPHSKKKIKE